MVNRLDIAVVLDGSDIPEWDVERDNPPGSNDPVRQQSIGISDGTNIITGSYSSPITEIVLSITGGNGDATFDYQRNVFSSSSQNGNVITFSDSSGVPVADANAFLNSLEFGLADDEPTGFPTGVATPSDPIPSNLTVNVMVMTTITTLSSIERTVSTTRNTIERNDPVVLVGLADGTEFRVSPDALMGSGSTRLMAVPPNATPTPLTVGMIAA